MRESLTSDVLERVLEALLFSSEAPLSLQTIQKVFQKYSQMGASDPEGFPEWHTSGELLPFAAIRDGLNGLKRKLLEKNSIYTLEETASGYRLILDADMAVWVRLLRNDPPPLRLSQSVLETLTVVAHKQPVTRSEVEHLRGVSADSALQKLLELELIEISGRADLPGRPSLYVTTEKFLEVTGLLSIDALKSIPT
jgi:segregation and condensation protein B